MCLSGRTLFKISEHPSKTDSSPPNTSGTFIWIKCLKWWSPHEIYSDVIDLWWKYRFLGLSSICLASVCTVTLKQVSGFVVVANWCMFMVWIVHSDSLKMAHWCTMKLKQNVVWRQCGKILWVAILTLKWLKGKLLLERNQVISLHPVQQACCFIIVTVFTAVLWPITDLQNILLLFNSHIPLSDYDWLQNTLRPVLLDFTLIMNG